MFDQVLVRPKPSRRKSLLIVATAAGHAAVISALVLVAFWKIDTLPVQERGVSVAIQLEAPPPAGAPPGEKLKVDRKVEKVKVVPKDPVQPTEVKEPPKDVGTTTTTTSEIPGGGGDNPNGDPNATGPGTGTCTEEPCGPEVDKTPPPKPDPDPIDPCKANPAAPGCGPTMVPPTVAAGLRISGNEKIFPPDGVKVDMMHAGVASVSATIKLCVDKGGRVDSVKLLKKTGYAGYDAELERRVRDWTYRAYQVNGKAVPMCTAVQINYRMNR